MLGIILDHEPLVPGFHELGVAGGACLTAQAIAEEGEAQDQQRHAHEREKLPVEAGWFAWTIGALRRFGIRRI